MRAFNQVRALVGAVSVIVKTNNGLFAGVASSHQQMTGDSGLLAAEELRCHSSGLLLNLFLQTKLALTCRFSAH